MSSFYRPLQAKCLSNFGNESFGDNMMIFVPRYSFINSLFNQLRTSVHLKGLHSIFRPAILLQKNPCSCLLNNILMWRACNPTWSHTAFLSQFHALCRSPFRLHNWLSRLLGVNPVENLQSHFILTMSHWSSGLPVCFPSQRTQVQIPRGVLMWNRDSPVSDVSLR